MKADAHRTQGRALSLGAVMLVVLALSSPGAQATYNPVASGATKITLDKSFLALLKADNVTLQGKGGATLKGSTLTFPATGGLFDPTTVQGTVDHDGSLLFKAGGKSVPLKALQLKTTQKRSPFSAKVGGGQLKVVSAASLKATRLGFGEKIKTTALKLTAKLATRLNKKLGLKGVFVSGQAFGSSTTQALPATVALKESGNATLTFAPEMSTKLASLFVAVNPIFPAERPGGLFSLPIFDGKIAPDASSGTLETAGALELLQQGGGQLFLREAWLDLAANSYSAEVESQPSPPYAGKQGRVGIGSLSLSGAAVASNPKALSIGVSGASVTLTSALAATLNEVFAGPLGKGDVFSAGETLGSVSFSAAAES